MEQYNLFGPRMRRAREFVGLTIAALAAAADCTEDEIRRLESGREPHPPLRVGLKVALALGGKVEYLDFAREHTLDERAEALEAVARSPRGFGGLG